MGQKLFTDEVKYPLLQNLILFILLQFEQKLLKVQHSGNYYSFLSLSLFKNNVYWIVQYPQVQQKPKLAPF